MANANEHVLRNENVILVDQCRADEEGLARKVVERQGLSLLTLEVAFKVHEGIQDSALDHAWMKTLDMIASAKLWIDGLKAIHYSQPARYLQQVRGYSRID